MTTQTLPTTTTLPSRTVDLFLWDANALIVDVGQMQLLSPSFTAALKVDLEGLGIDINPPQWGAWRHALEHRLTLVWGPPGTGKTQTLRSLITGLCVASARSGAPLRLLISASNYNAFDNVLRAVARWRAVVAALVPSASPIDVYRLRSESAPFPPTMAQLSVIDVPTDARSQVIRHLRQRLDNPHGIAIVASTPDQVFNLVTKTATPVTPIGELFNYVLVDEASQMDVGHVLPLLCAASADAQIALAGDPMQLPPIQGTPRPVGAEYMLESVYAYIKTRFAPLALGGEQTLELNYRSNEEIVSYGRALCYDQAYQSNSQRLRLALTTPVGAFAISTPPSNWPASLEWSSFWADILDPDVPVVCFSYSEGRSGQSNRFESQAVASLIWLLWEASPFQQLANEISASAPLLGAHTFDSFWKRGVGVVTPHSAQKSMIVEDIKRAFGATFAQSRVIRDAVDTVEKLQGQQRDVIVASFAIGDPDIVAQEQEFLFMLQRFNVMASRPRAKLIVFVTDEILDHVSDDNDVLENSRAIKLFARTFCRNPRRLTLPWRDRSGVSHSVTGEIRSVP